MQKLADEADSLKKKGIERAPVKPEKPVEDDHEPWASLRGSK